MVNNKRWMIITEGHINTQEQLAVNRHFVVFVNSQDLTIVTLIFSRWCVQLFMTIHFLTVLTFSVDIIPNHQRYFNIIG